MSRVFDEITNVQRLPILIPSSQFSLMLVKHTHEEEKHGGNNILLQVLTERFEILKVVSQIDKVIRSCVACQRFNRTRKPEQMGPLPAFYQEAAQSLESQGFMFVASDYSSAVKVKKYTLAPRDIGLKQVPFNVFVKGKAKIGRPSKKELEARKNAREQADADGYSCDCSNR